MVHLTAEQVKALVAKMVESGRNVPVKGLDGSVIGFATDPVVDANGNLVMSLTLDVAGTGLIDVPTLKFCECSSCQPDQPVVVTNE